MEKIHRKNVLNAEPILSNLNQEINAASKIVILFEIQLAAESWSSSTHSIFSRGVLPAMVRAL
jgi:hypothetical protein